MTHLPLSRRSLLLAGLAAGITLLVVGRYLASAGTPSAAPAPTRIPAPPGQIISTRLVVHVVGAVRRPGLYRLGQGGRIADAVARAGGATRAADLAAINLAAPLADGEQVAVPRRLPNSTAASGASEEGGGAAATGPLHLSTATLEQLDTLPGVGPVTAQRILDYRDAHGTFASVDELDAVSGIGPARLDQLRELVAP